MGSFMFLIDYLFQLHLFETQIFLEIVVETLFIFMLQEYHDWSNVANFNEIILCVQRNNYCNSTNYLYIQQNNYFDSTNYLYIQRNNFFIQQNIYIFNEIIIMIQRIIYIFNEKIIFIQQIIYIFHKLFTYSTKELFSFNQLNVLVQRMNWSTFIQPNID